MRSDGQTVDVDVLIQKMTLAEKAALCTGASAWTTTPIERLDIPELLMTDGPHGVRRVPDVNSMGAPSLPATCFPTASALAASWDVALLREMGQALAVEAQAQGVGLLLGPGINMKRSPLCGRNFEYFAEDPLLAGELAAALISGIQSQGVGTSLKHFAANNQETRRFTVNADVDERTLREIYLPAFEIVVKKAQPWSIMCAYNKLNGTFCSEHKQLLIHILKDEWGFEGFVVSDWGAVRDRVAALAGGLDLEMPGPKARRTQEVIDAVHAGQLSEAVLNEAARRILRIVFKVATFPKPSASTFDADAHHALARRIAGETIVLLKNEGLLPLPKDGYIAVIGRSAQAAHIQGGGSSHINPTQVDVPFAEVQALASDAEVVYSQGYPAGLEFDQTLIEAAVQTAQDADVALLYIALPASIESEGYDRTSLDLTSQQVALIKAVCAVQPRTVVILNSGGVVTVDAWFDAPAAVLQAWMMGQAGGGAIADVLFGEVNPSGKLAETYPLRLADTPAYLNFPGDKDQVRYGEGLYIGYRYYDAKALTVRFPFGFGLSYTTFAYSNLRLSSTQFKDSDGLTVSVDVTNTGALAGKEVVQVYVHDQQAKLARPPKELKGFAKVMLQPGETKTVTIGLDFRAFAYYHPGHDQWIAEDGDFDILVGASVADIRCQATATLTSTVELSSLLNRHSTIGDWLEDPRGRVVFAPLYEQMMAGLSTMFGSEEHDSQHDSKSETQAEPAEPDAIGMDMMGFLRQTPLLSILHFQESALPAPADAIVDGLLAQL